MKLIHKILIYVLTSKYIEIVLNYLNLIQVELHGRVLRRKE